MISAGTIIEFTGGSNGGSVLIAGTATGSADTIHTFSTTDTDREQFFMWAQNNHTANVVLTVEWCEGASTKNIVQTIPFKQGLFPVIPGLTVEGVSTITVQAFAATTNVITVFGHVIKMSTATT